MISFINIQISSQLTTVQYPTTRTKSKSSGPGPGPKYVELNKTLAQILKSYCSVWPEANSRHLLIKISKDAC